MCSISFVYFSTGTQTAMPYHCRLSDLPKINLFPYANGVMGW
jgi:hypothetical protein